MASGSEGQRPVIRHVSFDRVREDIEPAEAHRLSRRTRVQIEDRVNHPDAPEGTVRLQMAPKRDKTGKAKLLPTVIDEEGQFSPFNSLGTGTHHSLKTCPTQPRDTIASHPRTAETRQPVASFILSLLSLQRTIYSLFLVFYV